jgi:hypothetical protein
MLAKIMNADDWDMCLDSRTFKCVYILVVHALSFSCVSYSTLVTAT